MILSFIDSSMSSTVTANNGGTKGDLDVTPIGPIRSMSRDSCANQFAEIVTNRIADIFANTHAYHFLVDRREDRVSFGLAASNDSNMYLKDLTADIFAGMVEVLLQFEQQSLGTARHGNKISILTYNLGWKLTQAFHLKIHPKSKDEFHSIILHYNPDEQVVRTLVSDKSYTEYNVYEQELCFITNNTSQTDVFHTSSTEELKCNFLISRTTHSIVAMNMIDMKDCKRPYHTAYRYARMLEDCFTDAVGGVRFAIDHSSRQMWVWMKCSADQFKAKVLDHHGILQSGEFLLHRFSQSCVPKPKECKGIFVSNLDYSVNKKDLALFFGGFGKTEVIMPKPRPSKGEYGVNRGYAFVTFEDTEAIDKAILQLGNKFLLGRKVILNYLKPRSTQ